MASGLPDIFHSAKQQLTDPKSICSTLGLTQGAKPNRDGYLIRCPTGHGRGNTPSCSVITGADGTVQVRCFACELSGSVVDLVAAVHSVHPSSDECKRALSDLLGGGYSAPARAEVSTPVPERSYMQEASAIWSSLGRVDHSEECMDYLCSRGLSAMVAAERDLLRLFNFHETPKWAWVRDDTLDRAVSWSESGHLLVARVFDAKGENLGLRGWRVRATSTPKRVPVCGYRADGLVLANQRAVSIFRREIGPTKIVIVEGESDWLSACTRWPELAVIGVYSGSWAQSVADAIPAGSRLVILTDRDEAGDNYAKKIITSIENKCAYRRA